jgi:hypothetical protein
MGVLVDRTPKCHCELAGEGIEYSWGCSKNYKKPVIERKENKRVVQNVSEKMSEQGGSNNEPRSLFFKAGTAVYSCLPCLKSAATASIMRS